MLCGILQGWDTGSLCKTNSPDCHCGNLHSGDTKNKLQKLEDALLKHMLTAADLADRGDMDDRGDRGDMHDMVETGVTGVTCVKWVTWETG